MATAKKVPMEQYKIVLELSEEEAEVLKSIVGIVGNIKGGGKIRKIDGIWDSLNQCDIKTIDFLFDDYFSIREERV